MKTYTVFGYRGDECTVQECSVEEGFVSFIVDDLEAEGFTVVVFKE